MATRDAPTPFDADNSSGSTMLAACNDWRNGDADSMSARAANEATYDAGYTTAGLSHFAKTIDQFLVFWGESIYELLGTSPVWASMNAARSWTDTLGITQVS